MYSVLDRTRKICMTLLFVLGILCIPIGIILWFSLPPVGTPEYVQVGAFRRTIGRSLYINGFYFLVISLLFTKIYSRRMILALLILAGALIPTGIFLGTSFQTSIYQPLGMTGIGLMGGIIFVLVYTALLPAKYKKDLKKHS